MQPEERGLGGYPLVASPTLYPGQVVVAEVEGVDVRATALRRGRSGGRTPAHPATGPRSISGRRRARSRGRSRPRQHPVARIGIEARGSGAARPTGMRLRSLRWSGAPSLDLRGDDLARWRGAWVDAFDHTHVAPGGGLDFAQDGPAGWAGIGGRAWRDLRIDVALEPPFAGTAGAFVRGRGARRRLALRVGAGAWWLEEDLAARAPLGPRRPRASRRRTRGAGAGRRGRPGARVDRRRASRPDPVHGSHRTRRAQLASLAIMGRPRSARSGSRTRREGARERIDARDRRARSLHAPGCRRRPSRTS